MRRLPDSIALEVLQRPLKRMKLRAFTRLRATVQDFNAVVKDARLITFVTPTESSLREEVADALSRRLLDLLCAPRFQIGCHPGNQLGRKLRGFVNFGTSEFGK